MKRDKGSPAETSRDELERQVEALRRDIRNLQLEHDLLKKANELLKKDLGVDLHLLSNRKKTALVDALREEYGLAELLERLDLARSSRVVVPHLSMPECTNDELWLLRVDCIKDAAGNFIVGKPACAYSLLNCTQNYLMVHNAT